MHIATYYGVKKLFSGHRLANAENRRRILRKWPLQHNHSEWKDEEVPHAQHQKNNEEVLPHLQCRVVRCGVLPQVPLREAEEEKMSK